MATTTMQQIEDFLALKRVAVVGVSRDPKELSHVLWQEFRQRRYEAVPVNPGTAELDGERCYASISEIDPPVEGALIITPPAATRQVVEDCAAAGISHIWLHRGIGAGSATPEAVAAAQSHGMDVVAGFCPFMFLPGTPFFHSLHGFGKKITGSYPKRV
jgi:uncharacterized protein